MVMQVNDQQYKQIMFDLLFNTSVQITVLQNFITKMMIDDDRMTADDFVKMYDSATATHKSELLAQVKRKIQLGDIDDLLSSVL